ncbi:hypothetical protein DFH09DRAFT_1440841 [Mycena vulgaris]|nr:hypothetical protein DFH09DRAFT_1440841 [Mycena vulgaris]
MRLNVRAACATQRGAAPPGVGVISATTRNASARPSRRRVGIQDEPSLWQHGRLARARAQRGGLADAAPAVHPPPRAPRLRDAHLQRRDAPIPARHVTLHAPAPIAASAPAPSPARTPSPPPHRAPSAASTSAKARGHHPRTQRHQRLHSPNASTTHASRARSPARFCASRLAVLYRDKPWQCQRHGGRRPYEHGHPAACFTGGRPIQEREPQKSVGGVISVCGCACGRRREERGRSRTGRERDGVWTKRGREVRKEAGDGGWRAGGGGRKGEGARRRKEGKGEDGSAIDGGAGDRRRRGRRRRGGRGGKMRGKGNGGGKGRSREEFETLDEIGWRIGRLRTTGGREDGGGTGRGEGGRRERWATCKTGGRRDDCGEYSEEERERHGCKQRAAQMDGKRGGRGWRIGGKQKGRRAEVYYSDQYNASVDKSRTITEELELTETPKSGVVVSNSGQPLLSAQRSALLLVINIGSATIRLRLRAQSFRGEEAAKRKQVCERKRQNEKEDTVEYKRIRPDPNHSDFRFPLSEDSPTHAAAERALPTSTSLGIPHRFCGSVLVLVSTLTRQLPQFSNLGDNPNSSKRQLTPPTRLMPQKRYAQLKVPLEEDKARGRKGFPVRLGLEPFSPDVHSFSPATQTPHVLGHVAEHNLQAMPVQTPKISGVSGSNTETRSAPQNACGLNWSVLIRLESGAAPPFDSGSSHASSHFFFFARRAQPLPAKPQPSSHGPNIFPKSEFPTEKTRPERAPVQYSHLPTSQLIATLPKTWHEEVGRTLLSLSIDQGIKGMNHTTAHPHGHFQHTSNVVHESGQRLNIRYEARKRSGLAPVHITVISSRSTRSPGAQPQRLHGPAPGALHTILRIAASTPATRLPFRDTRDGAPIAHGG